MSSHNPTRYIVGGLSLILLGLLYKRNKDQKSEDFIDLKHRLKMEELDFELEDELGAAFRRRQRERFEREIEDEEDM
jgi:hypothetical protein